MVRMFAIAVIVTMATVLAAMPAQAEKRVALIIGNTEYDHVPPLTNPANDTADMAVALERLGFDVEMISNQNFSQMRGGLRDFRSRAIGADIAFVYYAGHGIEVDKQNYLIPIDAELKSDGDVEFEAVSLDLVMRSVEGARNLRLVVIDACRDNPFAAAMKRTGASRSIGRGLARIEPAGNTLVAFAAKEGTTAADGDGRNSPFASALLTHIEEPGLEIGLLFRKVRDSVLEQTGGEQEPFLYGSLSSAGVYLKEAAAPAVTRPAVSANAATTTTGSSFDATGIEIAFWNTVKDINDPTMLRTYLARYPNGAFADLATLMIEKLEKGDQTRVASVNPASSDIPDKTGSAAKLARDITVSVKIGEIEIGGERRSAMGAEVAQIEPQMARSLGLPADQGTAVVKVTTAGPADLAGVRPGDVVIEFNSQPIRQMADLPRLSGEMPIGAVVSVKLKRYGQGLGEMLSVLERAALDGDRDAAWTLHHLYAKSYGGLDDPAQKQRWTRMAAESGDSEAQYAVSLAYQNGDGVPEDNGEALRWARLAAEKNHATALTYVGYAYENGLGVAEDLHEAARWYRKGADLGQAYAQYSLGRAYATGSGGLPQDAYEAVSWHRKSAEQGNSDAQYEISIAYQNGTGVSQDYGEALNWARKAAAQDHGTALAYIGFAYEQGYGVDKDLEEAVKWYRQAADRGHSFGEYKLGRFYEVGLGGLPVDAAESYRWYLKSAEHGDDDAEVKVGNAYMYGNGVGEDEPEAVRWYRKAVEKGNAQGQTQLGVAYMYGYGVDKDESEAASWFRKGAEQGDSEGQRRLGFAYQNGEGVKKDLDEAMVWWRKAAEQGDMYAESAIGWAYRTGTGVRQDHNEAVKWLKLAADKGEVAALNNLGSAYDDGEGVPKDPEKAAGLIFDSIKRGNEFTLDQMKTNIAAWSVPFRRELQRLLREQGLYDGSIDGQVGPATTRALEKLFKTS